MLDLRRIRNDLEGVKKALARRGGEYPIDKIVELDEKRRKILVDVEAKKLNKTKYPRKSQS